MNISWGSDEAHKFVTNVGLITSNGPHGPNIMACEWTHHVSYSPGLIAVCIGFDSTTNANIKKTKEFGVSLCSVEQSVLSSIAGSSSGKETDKIKALEEMGFKFYKAKKIAAPMVKDAALNVECKLFKEIVLGDHTMFVGEAVAVDSGKEPLAFHGGRYWKLTQTLEKPSEKEREEFKKIIEKHKKK